MIHLCVIKLSDCDGIVSFVQFVDLKWKNKHFYSLY